jgi:hypothetical protein
MKKPFTRMCIVIRIVGVNPASGPRSYYPQSSSAHSSQGRVEQSVSTHRYAGGRAKIRLMKTMARQDWPRLSPKAVGPRVPVENLRIEFASSARTRTASEGMGYARHDADIRGEPQKEQFDETRICPVLDSYGLNTYSSIQRAKERKKLVD